MFSINKKWNVFLYSVIFVWIAMTLSYIIFTNNNIFLNTVDYQRYELKLTKNINNAAILAFKYNTYFNSDGEWFSGVLNCPPEVSLSWTTASWIIQTINNFEISFDDIRDIFYCSWSNSSWSLQIYYDNNYLSFTWTSYSLWTIYSLSRDWLTYKWSVDDIDNSIISFTSWTWISNIDNNMNSDDYRIFSTWNILYPGWKYDNDTDGRQLLYWYIDKFSWYYNTLWINDKWTNYIENNTNNTWWFVYTPLQIGSWFINLYTDNPSEIKLIEFNKDLFNSSKELKKINEYNLISSTWSQWFLSFSWDTLSLVSSTWSASFFDFINKDYWLFISFTWTNISDSSYTLRYKIKAFDSDLKPIYIVPINDTNPDKFTFFSQDIIIMNWYLYTKQEELNNSSDVVITN